MTFDEAREVHLRKLHGQLIELYQFATDPSWTNFECREFKNMMEKIVDRLKAITRLNDAAVSVPEKE